jgi:hypothetical protein
MFDVLKIDIFLIIDVWFIRVFLIQLTGQHGGSNPYIFVCSSVTATQPVSILGYVYGYTVKLTL